MLPVKPGPEALDAALQGVRALHPGADPLPALAALTAALRPRNSREAAARIRWLELLRQLEQEPATQLALREALLGFFAARRQVAFFSDSGLLPNSGFFSEAARILAHKLLPEPRDRDDLRSGIRELFPTARDAAWIGTISDEERHAFWRLLRLSGSENANALQQFIAQLLDAALVLSHRICGMGLEPELARVCPRLLEPGVESPFIALNAELLGVVEGIRRTLLGDEEHDHGGHVFVLLEQCAEVVQRARQASATFGTSMRLSFILVRLTQHLERLRLLLEVLTLQTRPDAPAALSASLGDFLHAALAGELRRNSLRRHAAQLLGLVALRITGNAARTGEHYIAADRADWIAMWRRAGGAGLLIALLALLKILASTLHLPPVTQAWLNAGIYAGGFALIHMLHFVIATKQPSMTAATLAAAISQAGGRLRDTERIVDLLAATLRSQLAAIAGNVLVALPVAVLVGLALAQQAPPPVSAAKAAHLLAELDALRSPLVAHAAIAGVWLFLTGLVSGYLDNRAASMRLEERIAQLRWLGAVLGERRAARIGHYLAEHAGGLGGNLFFGLMLGLTPAAGLLLGLPLDIRHVAFSSANLGYALAAMDFAPPEGALARACAGVALIGFINLTVSFGLALWVAMRSHGIGFARLAPVLPRLAARLRSDPRSFVVPPVGPASAGQCG